MYRGHVPRRHTREPQDSQFKAQDLLTESVCGELGLGMCCMATQWEGGYATRIIQSPPVDIMIGIAKCNKAVGPAASVTAMDLSMRQHPGVTVCTDIHEV